MDFPKNFIAATREYATFEQPVPAPYLRRSFTLTGPVQEMEFLICGLGFYELYINGTEITRGRFAPYISNPDHYLYYDRYDLAPHLQEGENVIGICLGNGLQNNPGGYIWDFDKAAWRGAPRVAFSLRAQASGTEELRIDSDGQVKCAPSPILFDDFRAKEIYDARLELPGWNCPGFDDSSWTEAIPVECPRGEARLCEAEPIAVTQELAPISIEKQEGGWLYDLGVNTAGIYRLRIDGTAGQEVRMTFGERLVDGRLDLTNILCLPVHPEKEIHTDRYLCKDGPQEYIPHFVYHGYQYVFVEGITEEQATPELLTCLVANSDLAERGNFTCSDEKLNRLQEITRRSTLANFYYFPTDCPQREKNGWTGDAALSAEHTLLNLAPEASYREWLRNIRKTQREDGTLPGIIPTGGWGYQWGNGPAWDRVLVYLPYYVYRYRGDRAIVAENADSIFRYVSYLSTHRDGCGLIEIGLGDWLHPGRDAGDPVAPFPVTGTLVSMDICEKAAFLFGELGMELQRDFALRLRGELRRAARERLVDFGTMTVSGNCQTAQAMGIAYGLFEPGELSAAFLTLMEQIQAKDEHMDTGILGARLLFHVLSDFGESDLAYRMIVRPDYPSYGNWLARGATTLWENFQPEIEATSASLNHHCFGDISGWLLSEVAGIRVNPRGTDVMELDLRPHFLEALTHAEAFHILPAGRAEVRWERDGEEAVILTVRIPEGVHGRIILENDWVFEEGYAEKPLAGGRWRILRR